MHKALLLKLALIKATIFTTDYIHKLTHFCCPRSTMRSAFWSTQLVGWDCYKDVMDVRVGDRGLCNSHKVLNMAEPPHEVWEMLDWFLGTETPVNQYDLNLFETEQENQRRTQYAWSWCHSGPESMQTQSTKRSDLFEWHLRQVTVQQDGLICYRDGHKWHGDAREMCCS